MKRKVEELSTPNAREDIDNVTDATTPLSAKRPRVPEKGGLLYSQLKGQTLRSIFYSWYVDENGNDIPDAGLDSDKSEKQVVYEARSRQKKFARTVKLMHLLCPHDKPETIRSKPLPTSREYAQWDKDIKTLSQTLDQKALELIRTHNTSTGTRSITTASKASGTRKIARTV